jgi:hypothetical protein
MLHPFLIPSVILVIIHSHTKNQVNISDHSEIKWSTIYLAKFQSPMVISWLKIIQPERISKLICNL